MPTLARLHINQGRVKCLQGLIFSQHKDVLTKRHMVVSMHISGPFSFHSPGALLTLTLGPKLSQG